MSWHTPTLEEKAELWQAVEDGCERLPHGWSIELVMEGGSASVKLYSPSYDLITPRHDDCESSLADQIKELVDEAVQNIPA